MFNDRMTPEEWLRAHEMQRKADLHNAKVMRDHWKREVDRLEAMDPLHRVSTGS